jgi:hypothetical protein
MDVKQAVVSAKKEITELFADEQLTNIGLEEVEFDDQASEWRVTIGFSRPWDEPRNSFAAVAGSGVPRRSYKIVRISNTTDKALSIKSRDIAN